MFDIAPTELIVLGTVALLVIPPKDLPRAMRTAGYWVGRARGVARQFRSGFDNMVREAELEEMEKRWKAENERIMREHPPTRVVEDAGVVPEPAMTAQPALLEQPVAPEPPPVTPPVTVQEPVKIEHPAVVAGTSDEQAPSEGDGKAMS